MLTSAMDMVVKDNIFVVRVKGKPDEHIRSFYDPPRFARSSGGSTIIVSARKGLLGLDGRGNLKTIPGIEISDGDPRVLLASKKNFAVSNGWQRISRFDRLLDGKSILSELKRTRRVFVINASTWHLRHLGSAVQVGIPVKITDESIYTFYTPSLEKWIIGKEIAPRFTIKVFNLKTLAQVSEHPIKPMEGNMDKFRFNLWLGAAYLKPKWQGSNVVSFLGATFRVER